MCVSTWRLHLRHIAVRVRVFSPWFLRVWFTYVVGFAHPLCREPYVVGTCVADAAALSHTARRVHGGRGSHRLYPYGKFRPERSFSDIDP